MLQMTKTFSKYFVALGLALASLSPAIAADNEELTKFINAYKPEDQQAISNIIDLYRHAPLVEAAVSTKRQSFGTAEAPMSLLEWIDIQCPHCKNLNHALEQLQDVAPGSTWRIESRHFPLDNECNPYGPHSRKPGVSCLAAKVLICLADKPNLKDVRNELFAQQRFLSKEIIWNTAAEDADTLKSLKACVDSEATQATLKEDIELAEAHKISGTPLVVVNGRKAAAAPPIIYALILAAGNPDAEAFKKLPPPQEMKDQPGHEGHDH